MAIITLTITDAQRRANGSVAILGTFTGNAFSIEWNAPADFVTFVNQPMDLLPPMLGGAMKLWQQNDPAFSNPALVIGKTFTINTATAIS